MVSAPFESRARRGRERPRSNRRSPGSGEGAVESTGSEATLPELQRERRKRDYHIFHYIGHGGYDSAREDGVLLSRTKAGTAPRDGDQLGTILADESRSAGRPRLCEGARTRSTTRSPASRRAWSHRESPPSSRCRSRSPIARRSCSRASSTRRSPTAPGRRGARQARRRSSPTTTTSSGNAGAVHAGDRRPIFDVTGLRDAGAPGNHARGAAAAGCRAGAGST